MGGPDTLKSARIKYQKRAKTLKSRAHDLADICGARVYLFIEHERECFVYKSVDDTLWPPPDGLLVSQSSILSGFPNKIFNRRCITMD